VTCDQIDETTRSKFFCTHSKVPTNNQSSQMWETNNSKTLDTKKCTKVFKTQLATSKCNQGTSKVGWNTRSCGN
jgi:hypothetical protein